MRIVIATSPDDPFGGVFWQAYMTAGGPPPVAVFFIGTGKSLNRSFWQRLLEPVLMFRLGGTIRLFSSVYLGLPLTTRDRKLGMNVAGKNILKSNASHCYHYESLNHADAVSALQNENPDLLISVGVGEIFKRRTLEIPKIGAINIHNGNLPSYRGHFGTFWEVYNGERWGYTCIHEMLRKVDAGGILALDKIRISDFSSFLNLILEKKRRGGALLAQIARETQSQGRLPAFKAGSNEIEAAEGYYGWPSFGDVLNFRKIIRRQNPFVNRLET